MFMNMNRTMSEIEFNGLSLSIAVLCHILQTIWQIKNNFKYGPGPSIHAIQTETVENKMLQAYLSKLYQISCVSMLSLTQECG